MPDLLDTSMKELQDRLTDGSITSVDLVNACLSNIARDNLSGKSLHAIIDTSPANTALQQAALRDTERAAGHVRSPLHGIPVLLSDDIFTSRTLGMRTTSGCLAMKDSFAPHDASVADRLTKAGAIIGQERLTLVLAKTNGNELNNHKTYIKNFTAPDGSGGVTTGFSPMGGQPSSAYVTGGDPLGGASGLAVGISAGFGAAGIAMAWTGNVHGPASRAALYSLQVTPALISRSGTVPVSKDHDTPGIVAFTPSDIGILLDVLRGRDEADTLTHTIPPDALSTDITNLPRRPLSSFSFGIARDFVPRPDSDRKPTLPGSGTCLECLLPATERAFSELRETGARVKDVYMNLSRDEIDSVPDLFRRKVASDFKEDFPPVLSTLHASVRSLEDLVAFNEEHEAESMPPGEYGQAHLINSLKAPSRDSVEYSDVAGRVMDLTRDRGLEDLFRRNDLDVLACSLEVGYPALWSGAARYPSATVPLGYCDHTGLPFGLMFIAPPWKEDVLLSVMSAYKDDFPARRPAPSEQ